MKRERIYKDTLPFLPPFLGDFRKILLVLIVADSSPAALRVVGVDPGPCAFAAMSYGFNPKSCGACPDRVEEPHFPLTLPSDLM